MTWETAQAQTAVPKLRDARAPLLTTALEGSLGPQTQPPPARLSLHPAPQRRQAAT